jgi:hypothetical protein
MRGKDKRRRVSHHNFQDEHHDIEYELIRYAKIVLLLLLLAKLLWLALMGW